MLRDEMEKLDNVICQLNRAEKGKKSIHTKTFKTDLTWRFYSCVRQQSNTSLFNIFYLTSSTRLFESASSYDSDTSVIRHLLFAIQFVVKRL